MERLEDALERLAPLLDQLPIGVQLIDGDMRYRYLNRVAAEHGRRIPEQLLGRTMQECYPGIQHTDVFRRIREILDGGEPCEIENAFDFIDGSQGWFELTIFRLHDCVVISSVDITRRKVLQVHHRHAQRMDATRQLAGGIAHDFNNLLTIIGAYTDLLVRDADLSVRQKADLVQVQEANRRATDLTRRLSALSLHARGAPKRMALEPFLRALTRTLASMMGEGISVRLSVHEGTGTIEVDPTAIEQVIVSLALNSREAMKGAGTLRIEARPVRIDATAYEVDRASLPVGDYNEVALIDDGPGLTPEQLDQLFDPYHLEGLERVGTGLGLAMCWNLVEHAGGAIHVEPHVGAGSTFRVVLPRFETLAEPAVTPSSSAPPIDRRSARVLVVDDELAIRRVVVRQLQSAGHSAVEAQDGAQALELLAQSNFDLVISDVLMPTMGGMELVRRLEERGSTVPLLFMSGHAPDAPASRLGTRWPLLNKPFTRAMLLDAVDGLLRSTTARNR